MIDKEDIYKNLEFASKAYSIAEGAFPLWEAVFALIVAQIFVTYFNINEDHSQKIVVALLGFIFSFAWLYLVGLNYLNAAHINKKMHQLRDILSACNTSTPFIWPWPTEEDKKTWNIKTVITGRLPERPQASTATPMKSTWFLRKILPGFLSIVWVALTIWQIWQTKLIIDGFHKMILVYHIRW